MLLLDDSSPSALAVDTRLPASAAALRDAIASNWPRVRGRVELFEGTLESIDVDRTNTIVSVHACGALTDRVLDLAISARANVAVLPCCQSARTSDTLGLQGWVDEPLAIDVARAARLRREGYAVLTQTIAEGITPKNRLLIGTVP